MTGQDSNRARVARRRLGLAVVVVAMWGCSSTAPTAPDSASLTATPTTIVVDGKTLILGTSLWRDFQPISPPDGKPMIVGLHVHSSDRSAVPASITGDTVWLVRGAEVWAGVPREESPRQDTAPTYELVARDGPKWEPGAVVDVVIQLRETNGRVSRLRAPNQLIRATF